MWPRCADGKTKQNCVVFWMLTVWTKVLSSEDKKQMYNVLTAREGETSGANVNLLMNEEEA